MKIAPAEGAILLFGELPGTTSELVRGGYAGDFNISMLKNAGRYLPVTDMNNSLVTNPHDSLSIAKREQSN